MSTNSTVDDVELQKFLASRLYQKIDYHKTNRMRIPVLVAVGNFALLKIMESAENPIYLILVALTMIFVSALGVVAMRTINKFFDTNVSQLEYLYDQMGMKRHAFTSNPDSPIAEKAEAIWHWLTLLVLISGVVPVVLLFVSRS